MESEINLLPILFITIIAAASPGPATLAIAGTSMHSGRRHGLALAIGIVTGSWSWGVSAAIGLGAILLSNVWLFETIRYVGACYLLFLAYKSAKSSFAGNNSPLDLNNPETTTLKSSYLKGLAIHATNPKAVLFFGSLFSIGLPADAGIDAVTLVLVSVCSASTCIFISYAFIFSSKPMVQSYAKMKRWFEAFFALAFGVAGIKILMSARD